MKISDHFNVKQMAVDAIDLFNERLSRNDVNGAYLLDDELNRLEQNYNIYIAKKKGRIKDDFPGKKLIDCILI
jgi:hypothetical protein